MKKFIISKPNEKITYEIPSDVSNILIGKNLYIFKHCEEIERLKKELARCLELVEYASNKEKLDDEMNFDLTCHMLATDIKR